jgi:hypothetical protein
MFLPRVILLMLTKIIFGSRNAPPTTDVPSGCPGPWQVDQETRNDVLMTEEIKGDTRIRTYGNQEREKRTSCDGETVRYGEWNTVSTRLVTDKRESRTDSKTKKIGETFRDVFREQKHGHRRYMIAGPRPIHLVHDGVDVTPRYRLSERTVTTDFDGHVHYGDWKTIKEYDGPTERRPSK